MNRLISVVLSFTLFFTIASVTQAAPATLPCEPSGNGTLESPYNLCQVQDFELIRIHPSAHFKLGRNIDFSGQPSWEPITWFNGSLDGNNYSILNLWSEENGLFIDTFGNIRNLRLDNANINGYGHEDGVGPIASTNHGLISDVTVNGNINALNTAGGMVANNMGTIERSYTTGWVTSKQHGAGGFVGWNTGTIRYSSSRSNVYSDYQAGGFVLDNLGEITDCEAWGHVIRKFNTGGAFAFLNRSSGTILRSKAFGNVYTFDVRDNLFYGFNSGTIDQPYATGQIIPYDQQPQW